MDPNAPAFTPARFTPGARAPLVLGVRADGAFHSPDEQAGRAALFISLGERDPARALERLRRLAPLRPALEAIGVDLRLLAPHRREMSEALNGDVDADLLVFCPATEALSALDALGNEGFALVDPSGRVLLAGEGQGVDFEGLCRAFGEAVGRPRGDLRRDGAPVLMLPNLLTAQDCRELIAHFEASPHKAGVMAGVQDGAAAAKLNEAKKRRRDLELPPGDPFHTKLLEVLAGAVVPEIKRAFNADMGFADRILLARYDASGGYFKRHRDNIAPQTRFREFAISLNLNTHEYVGGELSFPEYDDHRYSPPAGGALVFSASLLHEALPVTSGRRYVALSFLSSAAGAA